MLRIILEFKTSDKDKYLRKRRSMTRAESMPCAGPAKPSSGPCAVRLAPSAFQTPFQSPADDPGPHGGGGGQVRFGRCPLRQARPDGGGNGPLRFGRPPAQTLWYIQVAWLFMC